MSSPRPPARKGSLGKYVQCFKVGLRQGYAERADWIGRSMFIVLILLVFSRLWEALREGGMLDVGNARDMLWYLAITEWIVIATPMAWRSINEDVRTGDVAYRLTRPISYLAYRFFESLGRLVPSWIAVGLVAHLAAFALSGGLPTDPRGLLVAIPLSFVAAAITILFFLWIGTLSFWMQDANPAYFVFQKLLFILGGLILPLSIYPDWLQRFAEFTPFPSLLYRVGRFSFGLEVDAVLQAVVGLGISAAAACALLAFTFGRARRALLVNGG